MAIKINGTNVINDSRGLENITNLKTINGVSILGSGDISIEGGGGGGLTNPIVDTALIFTDSSTEFNTSETLLATTVGNQTLDLSVIDPNTWWNINDQSDLQNGSINYIQNPSIELTLVFPAGQPYDQRFVDFVNLAKVGNSIKFIDPNNYLINLFGFTFDSNFIEILSVESPVPFSPSNSIKLSLSGNLLTTADTFSTNMYSFAQNGIQIQLQTKNVVITTNLANTSTIQNVSDIFLINGFGVPTNELSFSGSNISLPLGLYISNATPEPDSPTATTLTTVTSVGTSTQTFTYGITQNPSFWFDGVAPQFSMGSGYFSFYFEHTPDYYGSGLDRLYFENQGDSDTTAMLQKIVDNPSGQIAVNHPGNYQDGGALLRSYEILGTPSVGGIVSLKLFGNMNVSPSSTGYSNWGMALDGVVKISTSATLIATSSNVSGASSIGISTFLPTTISTLYFGNAQIAVPITALTGGATGFVISPSDFSTYFPSGISAGSAVNYFLKNSSFPSGSEISYKDILENVINLYNRSNIGSGISINDQYGKITVGDDDYITIKYDTETQPELYTSGKIIWNPNLVGYVLSNDFFKEINDTPCIIEYVEMHYTSPSFSVFATTRNQLAQVVTPTTLIPNWTWPMAAVQINGSTINSIEVRRDTTALKISSQGGSGSITELQTSGADVTLPRIIFTIRFRPLEVYE